MQTAHVIFRLKSVEPQLRAFGVAGLYICGSYARNVPVNVDYGTRSGLSKFIRDDVEREAIQVF